MSPSIQNNTAPQTRSAEEHAMHATGYLACALGIVGVIVLTTYLWNRAAVPDNNGAFAPSPSYIAGCRATSILLTSLASTFLLAILYSLTFEGEPSTYSLLKDKFDEMVGGVKERVAAKANLKLQREARAATENGAPHYL